MQRVFAHGHLPLKTEQLQVQVLPRGPFGLNRNRALVMPVRRSAGWWVKPPVRRPGRQHQLGMSTGQASRACLLNSALLATGVWCESTAFRQPLQAAIIARVVQRGVSTRPPVRLISGVALDQCRVPERYRTRVPAFATSVWGGEGCPPQLFSEGGRYVSHCKATARQAISNP